MGSRPDFWVSVTETLGQNGDDLRQTRTKRFRRTVRHVPQSPQICYFLTPRGFLVQRFKQNRQQQRNSVRRDVRHSDLVKLINLLLQFGLPVYAVVLYFQRSIRLSGRNIEGKMAQIFFTNCRLRHSRYKEKRISVEHLSFQCFQIFLKNCILGLTLFLSLSQVLKSSNLVLFKYQCFSQFV